jgi:hypothetical protein
MRRLVPRLREAGGMPAAVPPPPPAVQQEEAPPVAFSADPAGNGAGIGLLPAAIQGPVAQYLKTPPQPAPANARLLGIGAVLLRVQESLTNADRAWLEGLQHRLPRHSRAQRWAATVLLPPAQLAALVDVCARCLDSKPAAADALVDYWRAAALYPSLLRRRSDAQLRYAMITPPSQLMVEAFGALRMPVTPESDSTPTELHGCADPGGGGAAAHRGRPAAAGAAGDRLRRSDSCRHCRHRRGGGCCGVCRRGGGGCCGVCRRGTPAHAVRRDDA